MGKRTSAIEWTERTINPFPFCDQTSPGCANCYAKSLHDMRHGLWLEHDGKFSDKPGAMALPPQYALPFESPKFFMERLKLVSQVKVPTTWFVNSMGDTFHESVPLDHIKTLFDVMNSNQHHTFQVLTKRAGRMAEIAARGDVVWTPNIWQGVTVENNRFGYRADLLRSVRDVQVRFISAEPLLGDLTDLELGDISWIIVGGESGQMSNPKIRPMHPAWVANIRAKARAAGTHFFFKQHGDWISLADYDPNLLGTNTDQYEHRFVWRGRAGNPDELPISCYRVGKKKAGRVFDGQTWDEMPVLAHLQLAGANHHDG